MADGAKYLNGSSGLAGGFEVGGHVCCCWGSCEDISVSMKPMNSGECEK